MTPQLYEDIVEPLVESLYDKLGSWETVEEFLTQLQKMPHQLAILLGAYWTYGEVGNGGFVQYFWNSSGIIAPEAVLGFQALDMPQCATIVERAMSHFGTPYPRNREQRHALIEGADEGWDMFKEGRNIALDQLNDDFFPLVNEENGGFEATATRYVLRYRAAQN
ncbi:MAG: DUF4375 domain-containing protein [Candidatus Eremiobacteraeota bacterium]|nr:DUF4375 domain-containing protein [Candidatus Eremiobacteraeota bacterium]